MAIIVNMLLVVLAVGCTMVASKPTGEVLAELHRDVQMLKRGQESMKKEFKQIKSVLAAAIPKSDSNSTLNIYYFQA